MIHWLEYTEVFIALACGVLCLVLGFLGKEPNDLSMGATAFVGLLMIVQLICGIVAPSLGNDPLGSLLEYWMYQVCVVIIPPLVIAWGLFTRTRWSTLVLGVAGLTVSVMVYRMGIIWFVQHA